MTQDAEGVVERLSHLVKHHLPLEQRDAEDYAEVFDANGEKVALTTRPDLVMALNELPALLSAHTPSPSPSPSPEKREQPEREAMIAAIKAEVISWLFQPTTKDKLSAKIADAILALFPTAPAAPVLPGEGWREAVLGLRDVLAKNIVAKGGPHRVKVGEEWFEGPLADAYIQTVEIVRDTLDTIAALSAVPASLLVGEQEQGVSSSCVMASPSVAGPPSPPSDDDLTPEQQAICARISELCNDAFDAVVDIEDLDDHTWEKLSLAFYRAAEGAFEEANARAMAEWEREPEPKAVVPSAATTPPPAQGAPKYEQGHCGESTTERIARERRNEARLAPKTGSAETPVGWKLEVDRDVLEAVVKAVERVAADSWDGFDDYGRELLETALNKARWALSTSPEVERETPKYMASCLSDSPSADVGPKPTPSGARPDWYQVGMFEAARAYAAALWRDHHREPTPRDAFWAGAQWEAQRQAERAAITTCPERPSQDEGGEP